MIVMDLHTSVAVAVSVLLILLTTICLRRRRENKKRKLLTTDVILKTIDQSKLFPLSSEQGWRQYGTWQGLRSWGYTIKYQGQEESSAGTQREDSVYGCYSKIKGSAQTLHKVLTDVQTFPDWRSQLREVKQAGTGAHCLQGNGTEPGTNTAAVTKATRRSADTATTQHDTICGTEDFVSSRRLSAVFWFFRCLRVAMRKSHKLKKSYKINRTFNKEDNGCCWLLELNQELQEWTFYLTQPVEKLFEIDHCMLTVISHPHKLRPGKPSQIPVDIVTSLNDYVSYRKVQCTPLVALTVVTPVEPPNSTDNEKSDSTVAQETPSKFQAKARTIIEDVMSKFNKTDEKKSEPMFIKRFRSLIEEKKGWYEEKKKKAAIKASESAAKTKEEIDSILDDSQIAEEPGDEDKIADNDQDIFENIPTPKTRPKLMKAQTIDCVEGLENDSEELAKSKITRSASFSERIKQRLWTEGSKKSGSLDSVPQAQEQEGGEGEGEGEEGGGDSWEESELETSAEDDVEAAYLKKGKETATELLAMKSKISHIDIKVSYDQQAQKSGGWIYCGLEREVVILRKIYEEGGPIQSYLGKGIIQCPPKAVFETLKNPRTRFTYDDMLKKLDVLHEFSNGMKIVHWTHEVSQLFKRESRDFVVLQQEQIEGSKYIISLRSVSWPDCEEREDVTRATLHSSGWIIEPAPKQNQLYSMVTYIVQMELGHSKTNTGYLIEELAAKQPLGIAFLRQYLTPSASPPRTTTPPVAAAAAATTTTTNTTARRRQSSADLRSSNSTLAALAAQYVTGDGQGRESLADPPVKC